MAERRMFAKTIIDSDVFIDMPISARLLYYDLAMRADDDGFVNSPKKIMKFSLSFEVCSEAPFYRNDWKSDIPWLGNKWYESAIRADMAIGEEYESGFYDEYYDLNSDLVKAQANAHGEY